MYKLPSGNLVSAQTDFSGNISDFEKSNDPTEYAFGRSMDTRSDPYKIELLPATVKEASCLGMPKDGDLVGSTLYYYTDTGNIYSRSSAGSHNLVRTVPGSHGNGMKYYTEDRYLYYTNDKVIGRYGQIGGTPVWNDDFLGSQGGVPLNTHWLDLEAGSSQYASVADTASLSITGDIALEATIKPESLPSVGSSMVIAGKWNTNGNLRSYKFEVYAVSGYFGDGSDGALTISSNTTEDPIDSACSGTIDTYSLSATNASFAAGQIILIHQTQGSGAGTWQRNKIVSYTAGTITLETKLNKTYGVGAQVRVLKQYTSVTVNSGITYTAKAWNGTTGGILAFLANGTVTVSGIITANGGAGSFSSSGAGGTGGGFRGGQGISSYDERGYYGEGYPGASNRKATNLATDSYNGNGGGTPGFNNSYIARSGGGGGNGTRGVWGTWLVGGSGDIYGSSDLTTMVFGGGGGGGVTAGGLTAGAGGGGSGGGIVKICAATIIVTGQITSNGGGGGIDTIHAGSSVNHEREQTGYAHGGGGGGGSILLKGQVITAGSGLITANGGSSGTGGSLGGAGRIHLDYYTSYTGTSIPSLTATQDNNLVTTTTYQLRLGLSSNGTNEEFLAREANLAAGRTNHVAVSWDASDSQAEFFVDGISIGTSTGAFTAIANTTAAFSVGCDFGTASAARNFFDGKVDEVRLWNTERTAAQFLANKEIQIATNSIGLASYYKLNNNYDDSTANANNMTAINTPVFATDVIFSSPTTRQDLDQSLDTSGQVYALTTSISEAATHRQTFVPQKDPQKSIEVNISDTGDDSDWTLTVHDQLNRTVASKTIAHANLHTGDFEFVFDDVWTPIRGASYHFHITATTTTGAPAVVTTTVSDLETADFHSYYQFLVEDVDYHPIEQMLNFIVIGNGRYVAKYAADGTYDPHRLVLPSGWKVRCFGFYKGYLAVGCWKGTNIYDTDQGIIFLWDGVSDTYNDYVLIPEGGINALLGSRGVLYVWAGYHGDMLEYRGGDYAQLVKRIPKMTDDTSLEIMPKAVTMWNALLRWGVAGVSDSEDVERGVYTWGKTKAQTRDSLSYDYPISTGNRASTNVKVGFCFPVAKKLLIGWSDNANQGMDVVDPAGACFQTGTIERNIEDMGAIWKDKQALVLRADFEPLNGGESNTDFEVEDFLLNDLTYISIDTMKLNKDTVKNQMSDADIARVVNTLATINVTHIAISPPMDETDDFISEGVAIPMPRTAANHTKAWFDAIHAAGKKVLFRGTFCGIEGIYDFEQKVGASRFPAGTAASAATDGQTTWLGKIDDWIKNHTDFWEDGDIFAPLPERTEGIFTDATAFLPDTGSGIQANYEQFFIDLKAVAEAAFSSIGKTVTCGMTANNFSEVDSGWINSGLFTDAGIVAIDHYGSTHTVTEMDTDLRAIYTAKSLPIFLQEWSDYWNSDLSENERIAYLKEFYEMLAVLISEGKLTGFNYWGGWAFTTESIIEFDENDNCVLNVYGELLKACLSQFIVTNGEFVKLKYKLNRADNWTEGAESAEKGLALTEGDKVARLNIPFGDSKEIQIAVDPGSDIGTSPKILGLGLEINPMPDRGEF